MNDKLLVVKEDVDRLIATAIQEIGTAESSKALQDIRVKYTGKKGELTQISKQMKDLEKDEKPVLGQLINEFHQTFNKTIERKQEEVTQKELAAQLASESMDISLPGRRQNFGTRHLLTQTREDLEDLFLGMGYQVIEGPEVELDSYNFEKMNLPKNHPARDMQDTFYISEEVLLRTHTSPVQARAMEKHDFEKNGPLKMVSPGKVFRRDNDDATHSHQFHQLEGLLVAEKITMADLKGTLLQFAKAFFGEEREIRLRPSFFSFTEPSVEVDVSCFKCGGQGCGICKGTGWIEVLGAGLVHPNVLEMSGIDSTKYSGFAFGVGIDRVAMLKHNVDDIRHFYQNDLRFLTQFKGGQN
ncbi:phenylalanine--tRNA ligase subunit alpha [Facklamia miroungae]|uniref:Phenylalanine--tRNA ligase alpha subunit n=1 Tax=Facklamia miroungae TaxID=120956 RepID=A0A1G7UPP4_9LACT|nr:phenylalanine--tRNA ligase subunit alpha [Facklamia miroungae]NKZ30171.1 phenylalanine--tRNA ligase subunit alpha [Facklamia miroungae]SDG49483.1 phenylalanyl-tRNA synthetase alpha chain [Facklamia miroungae]